VDRGRAAEVGGAVTSRLAASSSGAAGAQDCQASIAGTARPCGRTRWKLVAAGAGTVPRTSDVTTPKPPAPVPRSAQSRSWSSMTIPRVDECPAKQCPPPRVAVGSPARRASRIVAPTSAGVARRTTAAGSTSWNRAMGGLRASL
jgi:hypothetical protein